MTKPLIVGDRIAYAAKFLKNGMRHEHIGK